MDGAYRSPEYTARIYGCTFRKHDPYVRAVFTGSAYRPLGCKPRITLFLFFFFFSEREQNIAENFNSTQMVEIFGNISTAFGTFAIH